MIDFLLNQKQEAYEILADETGSGKTISVISKESKHSCDNKTEAVPR